MRVLLVNGSPNKNGTTNRALEEVDMALRENGIETEMFWIGISPIAGCIGCSKCFKSKRCIYNDVVLSLIHISEPTRRNQSSRMPSSA